MSRTEVHNQLKSFCQNRKPATLILGQAHLVARFVEFNEDRVTLDLPEKGIETFHPLSSAIVVSHQPDDRTFMFLSLATSYRNGNDQLPLVELTVPKDFIQTECRSTFRVPVSPSSRLGAQIKLGEKTWKARCVNLSLAGCLLEVVSGDFPEQSDDDFLVQLSSPEVTTELIGQLRHSKKRLHGFFFPDAMQAGEIVPPPALRRIVVAAEREWLRNRNR